MEFNEQSLEPQVLTDSKPQTVTVKLKLGRLGFQGIGF